jgi:hypothetical protein
MPTPGVTPMRRFHHKLASACALAVALAGCTLEHHMKFDRIEYQYAASMGSPETLSVQADGRARYESHTAGALPEIGRYETRLPPAQIEALERVVDNPPFKGLGDHFGRVVAGDRYTRVRMISGATTVEKMVGTKEPVDVGLSRVIDQLKAIAAEVARHPQEILRMEAGPLTVDGRATLTATLRFSNPGTQPIAWLPPSGHLTVRAWPDKPVADFVPGDLFELRGAQVSCVAATPSAPAAIAHLAPGDEAVFRVSATLSPRAPGTHVIQLIYRNTTEQIDGQPALVGEISVHTVKVELAAPAANAR